MLGILKQAADKLFLTTGEHHSIVWLDKCGSKDIFNNKNLKNITQSYSILYTTDKRRDNNDSN